jgi:hypothetical protein
MFCATIAHLAVEDHFLGEATMLPLLFAFAAAQPTQISAIALRPGINAVPAFTADGRAATVVQAWRENGNAHGYNTFQVMVPRRPGGVPDQLIDIDGPQHPEDLVRDDPFDGERQVGVVRFARAKLDGRRQTVLITADLNPAASGVLADHATATVKVYRLVHDEGVGDTWDHFELAWSVTTAKGYCNVQLALRDTLGVPLGRDFGGVNRTDGCF